MYNSRDLTASFGRRQTILSGHIVKYFRVVIVLTVGTCYKDYPGLGNRSVFYPYSSVGNTLTFDVVQVTDSNLTSKVSFTETLARAHLKKHIFLVPQVMKRGG